MNTSERAKVAEAEMSARLRARGPYVRATEWNDEVVAFADEFLYGPWPLARLREIERRVLAKVSEGERR